MVHTYNINSEPISDGSDHDLRSARIDYQYHLPSASKKLRIVEWLEIVGVFIRLSPSS